MSTPTESPAAQVETHAFEADVQQVLNLVIHSLYSNKDIFLRELISNASDACEKLRFEAIAEPAWLAEDAELAIEIGVDRDARTIAIRDNGIGMSHDELVGNLGTVARSGTKRYLEGLAVGQKADAQLIGQFGVGFYSAFIVAESIAVTSRRAGEQHAWTWRSAGDGRFTIEAAPADTPRGTRLELKLREGEDDYLQEWKLRGLIRTYSDHIGFPIRIAKAAQEEGAAPTLETINQASALWTRPKQDIGEDDYKAFYKHIVHDFNDPLAWTHNRVEGNQNFTSLLFLPERAPFDMQSNREDRKGLKLYVKRIFIMDAAEQMLPAYLRFVRGVVDSDDLPLNVSRELLQESRQVERIKGALGKRALDMIEKIAQDDSEKYDGFWNEFGSVLKEGVVEDAANRERVLKLLRFPTTRSDNEEQRVSLDDYIARMAPLQEEIYYITADGWNAAKRHPKLEALKARGIEVLLMHERIDEWMSSYLHEYAGKRFRNVAKGELDLAALGEEGDKNQREEAEKAAGDVVAAFKTALGERVKDVRVTHRLTDSAACLIVEEHDMSLHMQQLFKSAGQAIPQSLPTLEINPKHALVLRAQSEVGHDEARVAEYAWLLFEQALLTEGSALEDPAGFVARMNRLLVG